MVVDVVALPVRVRRALGRRRRDEVVDATRRTHCAASLDGSRHALARDLGAVELPDVDEPFLPARDVEQTGRPRIHRTHAVMGPDTEPSPGTPVDGRADG